VWEKSFIRKLKFRNRWTQLDSERVVMFLEEAKKIGEILLRLELDENSILYDVGSSTEEYRCLYQPYVDYYLFRPLRAKKVAIIHVDRKKDNGVDLVCDITDRNQCDIVKTIRPADVVLCCSLLEHVTDRQGVVSRLGNITKPGGVIVVTVPHVFVYHEDPIDTMYRPSNTELEELFPKEAFDVIESSIIEIISQPLGYKVGPFRLCGSRNIVLHVFQKTLRYVGQRAKRIAIIPNEVSIVVVKKK